MMQVRKIIADNMFPQFKSWEQLLHDTNHIFHWDNLLKEDYQIEYEKALKYAKRKEFHKASEAFAKAATMAVSKRQEEISKYLTYCFCEATLRCGNPEALVQFTQEMYEYHNRKFPKWMVEKLGMCGIAYALMADDTKDLSSAKELYRVSGWLLTEYFNETGDFKDYNNEIIYYTFYGYILHKTNNDAALLAYLTELRNNVPTDCIHTVIKWWEKLGIV